MAMQFFENLVDCLNAALSPKLETRKNGEREIRNLRDQDARKFLATLTREIANENLDVAVRQMACIIFKNFIAGRSGDPKYENFWINLDVNFKSFIKEAILATLASEHALVRGQIASIVAAIASIEIPRQEWEGLVPNLATNAEHTDYNIRLTSLTTLGYICEEIRPEDLSVQLKNVVIIALTNNIICSQNPQEEEPCRLAVRAMLYSIPYASQNFLVKNERDYIMDRIILACQSPNEEIAENALACLTDITTQEYENIDEYFLRMCEATYLAASHTSPKIGARAFEYWTTLIEDETERTQKNVVCRGYI